MYSRVIYYDLSFIVYSNTLVAANCTRWSGRCIPFKVNQYNMSSCCMLISVRPSDTMAQQLFIRWRGWLTIYLFLKREEFLTTSNVVNPFSSKFHQSVHLIIVICHQSKTNPTHTTKGRVYIANERENFRAVNDWYQDEFLRSAHRHLEVTSLPKGDTNQKHLGINY